MDHGEITTGAYEQVWHECFNEVMSSKLIRDQRTERTNSSNSAISLQIDYQPKRYILGSFLAK